MKKHHKLNNDELSTFCGQMAMLIKAGITPVESLSIMQSDLKSSKGKALLKDILENCKKGEPFHKALSATNLFPDYCINTIALGEESGNLDYCMDSLSAYYEKEVSVSDSIRSAVTYPLLMITIMLIVIFVLISRVMPIFNQVFIELGSEMNGFAASLLSLGEKFNQYSFVFILVLLLLFLTYFLCTRTRQGKAFSFKFLIHIPMIRNFYESLNSERFASGMALCLTSGMDTYTSLNMAKELVNTASTRNKIDKCIEGLHSGMNLSEAMAACGIFNNTYSQMIAVGFKSGNIDRVLSQIANKYKESTDKKMQTIISTLEPTLVIILSVIVGLILLSVILPLMGIMASIG